MQDPLPANFPKPNATVIAVRAVPRRITRWSRASARVREFFRPDNLRQFLSTLTLVAPLTVLVWVWAEREQAVEVPDKKPFAIAVRASNPAQRFVSIAPGQSDTVIVEMSGPRAGVEGVKDAVGKEAEKGRLLIDVSDAYEPGASNKLELAAILNQQKIFRDYGVTVHATQPAELSIVVDRQVERDVMVKLPAEVADSVQSATFEPKTVKVRGPEHVIKQLEMNGGLRAELEIVNLNDLGAPSGQTQTLPNVPLRAIDAPGVSFDVDKIAKVTLQLSEEKTDTIASMVVSVNKPAGLEGRMTVTVSPLTLTGVKVIGPSDTLRQLREKKISPGYAVLTITLEDNGKTGEVRTPTFPSLPAGVRVVEPLPQVTFSVTDSTATGETTPIP